MNEEKILGAIDVEKDVDGFHPLNVGKLALQGRTPLHVSCTPRGCIELLLRSGVTIAGKHAVVIGRSNVVGMPVATLLQVSARSPESPLSIHHLEGSHHLFRAATCWEISRILTAVQLTRFSRKVVCGNFQSQPSISKIDGQNPLKKTR